MFELSEELKELQKIASSVADDLRSGYVARDHADAFDWDVLQQLAAANLLGLNVPVEAGGQGAGELAAGVVVEQIAYGDFSVSSYVTQSGLVTRLLYDHGDEEVRDRWLPEIMGGRTTCAFALTEPGTGTDLRGTRMQATRRGGSWVLRGEKSSVSLPESDVILVMARTDEGLALFAVPGNAAGISSQRIGDLGFRAQGRAVKIFDDVQIPANYRLGGPGVGLPQIMGALASSKVHFALSAVGTAHAAVDEAVAWSGERETFGRPLATRQGVAFPLARAAIELDAARLLCWRALELADDGVDYRIEAAQAKAWIPPRMVEICRTALLTVGHVGYSTEHPAQLRLRDIIATELGEGTEQANLLILSKAMFGVTPS